MRPCGLIQNREMTICHDRAAIFLTGSAAVSGWEEVRAIATFIRMS